MRNKKMANVVFLIFYTLALQIGGLEAAVNEIKCERDHECPKGKFCYLQVTCATCINCSIYNRKGQKNRSCHKEPLDCGDCLPGFKEEDYIEGHRGNTCKQDESSQHEVNSLWIIIPAAVIIIGLISVLFYVFYRFCKSSHRQTGKEQSNRRIESTNVSNHDARSNEEVITTHSTGSVYDIPPPYYECDRRSASAPLLQDIECTSGEGINEHVGPVHIEEKIYVHYESEKEHDNKQEAVVFRKYKYDRSSESESEPEAVEILQVSGPIPQDEETLESNWTPDPNYGTSSQVPNENDEVATELMTTTENLGTNSHNDSGLSSSDTSSSSINRHFEGIGESSEGSVQDEANRIRITRSHSDDALNTSGIQAKRQRRDSGTHSLQEASTSDAQSSDDALNTSGIQAKRQRRDSGTHSLQEASTSDAQSSDDICI